jgi:DNA recombination protein RmuC
MENYLAAANCSDIAERERLMNEHSRAVISHIDLLSRKAYSANFTESIDFVIMFLPSESLLESALQYRPDLLDYAFSRNIVPATPTTLFALLRGVGMSWKNNEMLEQALEISQLSRELYTRVDVVFNHFNKLGKSLQGAVTNYNLTVRSIESRVRPTGAKLADLGMRTEKNEEQLTAIPELDPYIAEVPPQLNVIND